VLPHSKYGLKNIIQGCKIKALRNKKGIDAANVIPFIPYQRRFS